MDFPNFLVINVKEDMNRLKKNVNLVKVGILTLCVSYLLEMVVFRVSTLNMLFARQMVEVFTPSFVLLGSGLFVVGWWLGRKKGTDWRLLLFGGLLMLGEVGKSVDVYWRWVGGSRNG